MIAIKLYADMPQDDENVKRGISGKIPAVVLFDVDKADTNFQLMTEEEYFSYIESIKAEIEEWKIIQDSRIEEAPVIIEEVSING